MDTIIHFTLTMFTCCIIYCGTPCFGQNVTPTIDTNINETAPDPSYPPIGEDVLTRAIDKGMRPVYEMTKFFLGKVMILKSLEELNNQVRFFSIIKAARSLLAGLST